MDDFAQSREPDDLFSDEIEPTEHQVTGSKNSPAPASNYAAANSHGYQRHGAPTTVHNHRVGRRGGHHVDNSSVRVDQPIQTESTSSPPRGSAAAGSSTLKPTVNDDGRVASVRGDRSATGPAKPTKKTEAELTELMKAMQLKNAAKTEAHARAEKDQASFLQREQQAAAKRVEERKAIREQDMERAKNRERKIKAQGGREWDSEKQENDLVGRSRGGSSMYSRGANGGVRGSGWGGERGGLASSQYGLSEDAEEISYDGDRRGGRSRSRGRLDYQGARGGSRGGRGRGRGSGNYFNGAKTEKTPLPSSDDLDFPALPKPTIKSAAALAATIIGPRENPAAPPGVIDHNWADEMATPTEKS